MAEQPIANDCASIRAAIKQDLADNKLDMPLMPIVASQILSSSVDDNATAARLAEIIQQDQSIASHMLRVVNSPLFRGTVEVVALPQAIARLGMERIREIALSISFKSKVFQAGAYDAYLEHAWSLALYTALWAREVARATRRNVEVGYLCGLLHNIGVPVILGRVSELSCDLDDGEISGLVEEFQTNAGCQLVSEWHLPEKVGEAVAYLGAFAQPPSEQDHLMLVEAGQHFAQCQLAQSLELENLLQHSVMQRLNLYPDDVEALVALAGGVSQTVESMS